jgi:proline racemase
VICVRTIDAHVEGAPVRLVVDGFPTPRGRTMGDRCRWAERHAEHLRRALMMGPRGHVDMSGALFTEPVTPGAHAGLLFMQSDGYGRVSPGSIIAVTTIALERGLILPGGDGATVVFDTVAGTLRARATLAAEGSRVRHVAVQAPPSFVLHAGLEILAGGRRVRADVAFGSGFYAIVDSEAVGLGIDLSRLPELRRAGGEIRRAVDAVRAVAHPLEPGIAGIAGTIFTGPSADSRSGLRSVTVFGDQQVDPSPGAGGTAALMAVLDAMGLVAEDTEFVHEGLIGTTLVGRITGRTQVADYGAIVSEISGSAWITGEHTFLVDDTDPLREGYRI